MSASWNPHYAEKALGERVWASDQGYPCAPEHVKELADEGTCAAELCWPQIHWHASGSMNLEVVGESGVQVECEAVMPQPHGLGSLSLEEWVRLLLA